MADEYRESSTRLAEMHRKRVPISRAPSRLCSIHAIELYLNAYLLSKGQAHREIRAKQHNLEQRMEIACELGLIVKKRTMAHLKMITEQREYLVSRYGAELTSKQSEINRLSATLKEVAKKVRRAIETAR